MQEELDKKFNPEAHEMKTKQEEKTPKETTVVKHYKDKQKKFTNKPQNRQLPSAGWLGRVRAAYKAGHISKEKMEELLQSSRPKSS